MKQQKSTIKRLLEFAESYDSDIIFIALMSVLLAIVIVIPILFDKIAWAFCAPLALILVYMIARGILDLIISYRWYFGIDKDNSQEQQNKDNTKEYLIPETISEEIFNLPCVIRVQKDEDRKPCYTIEPYSLEVPAIWVRARVGDTLVQLDNGKWKLIKKGE